MYVKDIFPKAKLVHFCEYFYRAEGADIGFDPAQVVALDDRARTRSRNALHLVGLDACDVGICPTNWQYSLHPPEYRSKLRIIHEGVDVDFLKPSSEATFSLADGRLLTRRDEVVTYVARNLEPYRGFPQFMRTVESLQRERPSVHVVIAGGDDVSYGSKPKDAPSWREKILREVQLDSRRTHFVGKLPYSKYVSLLQVSRAHVYLTYPFVLSWSMLEAMACGCVVVGSDTTPVREVVRHRENGYLVDFFDSKAQTLQLMEVLDNHADQDGVRALARRTIVDGYDVRRGVARYMQLIDSSVADITPTTLPSMN